MCEHNDKVIVSQDFFCGRDAGLGIPISLSKLISQGISVHVSHEENIGKRY